MKQHSKNLVVVKKSHGLEYPIVSHSLDYHPSTCNQNQYFISDHIQAREYIMSMLVLPEHLMMAHLCKLAPMEAHISHIDKQSEVTSIN